MNAITQIWECGFCTTIYKSPTALAFPPTHHCPGPKARKVRDFTLRSVQIETKQAVAS